MNWAPICLFTYKRLDCTVKTVEALQKNSLAKESKLFIFSDGPKREEDRESVQIVRDYVDKIDGFQEIKILKKEQNSGLANSIIGGVSDIVEEYGKVIVIEDDLLTTPNFLTFMNKALNYYESNQKIFSIGGYTINVNLPRDYSYDVYAVQRATPWGWATWKDRWQTVDWQVKRYEQFKQDRGMRNAFNQGGSDLANMLDRQMESSLDSWAIRWIFQQYVNQQYTIFPTVSKIRNIGFGDDATHTKFYDRYRSTLDETAKEDFKFMENVRLEKKIVKSYLEKYSLRRRFIGRLKHYLGFPPSS